MPSRMGRIAVALLAMMIANGPSATIAWADTLVFHATTSGKQALDRDAKGGNPFASALIESLATPSLRLADLPASLERLTLAYSQGYQAAEVPQSRAPDWQVVPARPGERRLALVLVISDYEKAGAQSLPGAKFDAERVAAALLRSGFETEVAVDLDRDAIARKLSAFADASRTTDAAVIYTTGHGVEVDGTVYLLPGDYPVEERNKALSTHAIALPRVAAAAQARHVNLVLYGGCRDNPLGE